MSQTPTPIIVPGWRDSGPGHWQSLWAESLVGTVRVKQNAGHINIESGFGEWPLGLALLQSLVGSPLHPLPAASPAVSVSSLGFQIA